MYEEIQYRTLADGTVIAEADDGTRVAKLEKDGNGWQVYRLGRCLGRVESFEAATDLLRATPDLPNA